MGKDMTTVTMMERVKAQREIRAVLAAVDMGRAEEFPHTLRLYAHESATETGLLIEGMPEGCALDSRPNAGNRPAGWDAVTEGFWIADKAKA